MIDNNHKPELNIAPIDEELELLEGQQEEQQEEVEDFILRAGTRRDERVLAFCMLYAADRSDYTTPLDDVLQSLKKSYEFMISDSSFAVTLAQGAIEERLDLEEEIKPYLKNWKLERLGCCTRLILRMALWELRLDGAIPSVIINEAVELAKMFAEQDAFRFVNGLLDEYCKNKGLSNPEIEKDKAD